jgi:hypothetical protein
MTGIGLTLALGIAAPANPPFADRSGAKTLFMVRADVAGTPMDNPAGVSNGFPAAIKIPASSPGTHPPAPVGLRRPGAASNPSSPTAGGFCSFSVNFVAQKVS